MMGFFVILLAMNMAKQTTGGIGGEGKYPSDEESPVMQDFAIAVRAGFGNPVDLESNDPRRRQPSPAHARTQDQGRNQHPRPRRRQS